MTLYYYQSGKLLGPRVWLYDSGEVTIRNYKNNKLDGQSVKYLDGICKNCLKADCVKY